MTGGVTGNNDLSIKKTGTGTGIDTSESHGILKQRSSGNLQKSGSQSEIQKENVSLNNKVSVALKEIGDSAPDSEKVRETKEFVKKTMSPDLLSEIQNSGSLKLKSTFTKTNVSEYGRQEKISTEMESGTKAPVKLGRHRET